MKNFIKSVCFAATLLSTICSAQASVIGNLNDGLNHTSATTGYWSLFVTTGDVVTVTARRITPVDIWAFATNGPDGSGAAFVFGDDQLPPATGGPWGDPLFTFTAATTGEYSVGVFRCCGAANETISYFVNAQGATGTDGVVPEPGTIALMGLGLSALALRVRKLRAV